MKRNIQVLSLRGGGNILNNLILSVDKENIPIVLNEDFISQYNIRLIFEEGKKQISPYSESILGRKLIKQDLGDFVLNENSVMRLKNIDNLLNNEINLEFKSKKYSISVSVFKDSPINHYSVIDSLPIPSEIVTVYFYFFHSYNKEVVSETPFIEKYFDGYSHLGFFLTDLPRMKEIIYKEYGDKDLDLVHEFSNTDIIDKLFKEEIIMIVWGINPYNYPIYACENPIDVIPLIGREYEKNGIFNIDENIKELSLVPGHELKNYPHFLDKDWKKIKLRGKGKKTFLKPYVLEDLDLETVIASFLIYREEGYLEESQPLMNVDLLYS